MKQLYDNTEKRPGILACPKCKRMLTDIVKRNKSGRLILVNSVCACGYSLREVKEPEKPLIQRI